MAKKRGFTKFAEKRSSLLSIINKLHADEGHFLEDKNPQNDTKNQQSSVVSKALLKAENVIDTVTVQPGTSARISCRSYLMRQKRHEGSLTCEWCNSVTFKLFPTIVEDKKRSEVVQVCKKCLKDFNEDSNEPNVEKHRVERKIQNKYDNYRSCGMTNERACNSWHFICRDLCTEKANVIPYTHNSNELVTEIKSNTNDIVEGKINENFPTVQSACLSKFEGEIPIIVTNVKDRQSSITEALLKDSSAKIDMIRDNAASLNLELNHPKDEKVAVFKVIEEHDNQKPTLFPGAYELVTSMKLNRGDFVKNRERSCFYNKDGFPMKRSELKKFRCKDKVNGRYRKIALENFLQAEKDAGSTENKTTGNTKKDVTEVKKEEPCSPTVQCAICKKVAKTHVVYSLNTDPFLAKYFEGNSSISVCSLCEPKVSYERLKFTIKHAQRVKNATLPKVEVNLKQVAVAPTSTEAVKRKSSSPPSVKAPLTKNPKLVSASDSKAPLTKKPTLVSVGDSKLSFTKKPTLVSVNKVGKGCVMVSSPKKLNDITINGKTYKVDTEVKLNELLKDNEKATKVQKKDILTQLPGILQRSLNPNAKHGTYKIVNIIKTGNPNTFCAQTVQNIQPAAKSVLDKGKFKIAHLPSSSRFSLSEMAKYNTAHLSLNKGNIVLKNGNSAKTISLGKPVVIVDPKVSKDVTQLLIQKPATSPLNTPSPLNS